MHPKLLCPLRIEMGINKYVKYIQIELNKFMVLCQDGFYNQLPEI